MKWTAEMKKALTRVEAIAIGSSAGGIEALKAILPSIKRDFPAAVIVVQHIGMKSSTSLVQFFQVVCGAPVKEVEDKEQIVPGTIYFAPAGYHILLESDRSFSLSVDAPVSFSRPSIDVMMESAADAFREQTMGIVLTGANQDGAEGLAAIAGAGGLAVVQDPTTAAFAAMPEAALKATPKAWVLTLPEVVEMIQGLHRSSPSKEI